jgi:hypothetical protein
VTNSAMGGDVNTSDAPPPALDWARVIAYAFVDSDVTWTGRQALYVDGDRLGPVPRLAICQNVFHDTEGFLLFFCNAQWDVLGVSARPTVDELQESAERWYTGITSKWIHTGITQEAAEKWLRDKNEQYSCSFCRKLPPQVENMIASGHDEEPATVRICNECIDKFHAIIHRPTADTN